MPIFTRRSRRARPKAGRRGDRRSICPFPRRSCLAAIHAAGRARAIRAAARGDNLSARDNQKVGLCLFLASQAKGYPFEVELPAGLEVAGVVLCDKLKSLDWKARRDT